MDCVSGINSDGRMSISEVWLSLKSVKSREVTNAGNIPPYGFGCFVLI